jgi:hypothetical protein
LPSSSLHRLASLGGERLVFSKPNIPQAAASKPASAEALMRLPVTMRWISPR